MARRLSDIIANGLRSLSISSCCSNQSDSDSSSGGTVPGPGPGQGPAIPLQVQGPAGSPQLPAPSPQLSASPSQIPLPPSSSAGSGSQGSGGSCGRRPPHPVLQALAASVHSAGSGQNIPGSSSGQHGSHSSASAAGLPAWMTADDVLFVDDPSLSHLKYNKFQDIGARRQRWIEDAAEPGCPVSQSSVSFADLQQLHGFPNPRPMNIDFLLIDQVRQLGLVNEFDIPSPSSSSSSSDSGSPSSLSVGAVSQASSGPHSAYTYFDGGGMATDDWTWWGHAGPTVLTLDNVYRTPTSAVPRIAYMAKAIYEHCHPLGTLKHVFIVSIVNRNTRRFCAERLYTQANNLSWPSMAANAANFPPVSWERGSAEYEGLLGTQFGKVIAYFMLAAYPRGTRRIARIVTWPLPLCMRFDIEDIPTTGS